MRRVRRLSLLQQPLAVHINPQQLAQPASGSKDAVARRRSPRGKGALPGEDDEDPGGSPSGSGLLALPKRQRTLDHTLVTAAQQASFDGNSSLFIYTTETPFWRCKNKFLKRAAQALGARVRDEKCSHFYLCILNTVIN